MAENQPTATLSAQIDKIAETAPPEPTDAGPKEQAALAQQLQVERFTTETEGIRQDIKERKIYAGKSFKLVSYWVAGVFLLLLLQGAFSSKFSIGKYQFEWVFRLPDSVLLAVVGGTTASVIGIFLVVANYLFPKK